MTRLPYPRLPCETSTLLAREILRGRYISDHKDYNRMLAALRERKLDVQLAYCGESAEKSIPVVEFIAEQNLRTAPLTALERKVASLTRQVGASVAASHAKVDPTRLGGRGAAGRQRDRARESEKRNLIRMQIERLTGEISRRAAPGQIDCGVSH